jgi:DNA-binding response OmpR family regulator
MATSQQLPPPRGRVLIVDDDSAVRAFLTDFLEQQYFDVRAVADGATALEAFRTEHFDLILVDFQMPGMSGLELAIEVRKTDPHIPIALITGTIQNVGNVAIVEAGINRTFPKPFNLNELSTWIRSLSL